MSGNKILNVNVEKIKTLHQNLRIFWHDFFYYHKNITFTSKINTIQCTRFLLIFRIGF